MAKLTPEEIAALEAEATGALYDKLVAEGKVSPHQPQHRGAKGGKGGKHGGKGGKKK